MEDKTPDFTKVDTNTTLNAKINEVKNEIPTYQLTNLPITNLATITALTAVENKIPDPSKLSLLQNLIS